MVSVKQALKKGQVSVTIPVFIIMFTVMCSLFYFSSVKVIPFYFTPLSFIIGPFCGWIFWSFAIVKWKLWAFKNVRNRHELKQKSIRAGLIWGDESFFNKTEIWTKFQREEWKKINQKFNQEDIIKDDLSVPYETIIKYSNILFWLNIVGIIFLFTFSYYSYMDEKKINLTFILLLLYAIYLVYGTLNNKNKTQFIKLNEKGLQTHKTEFLSWSKIEKINVYRNGFGKNTKYFLKFSFNNGGELLEEKINLIYYSSNFEEIEDLIKLYKKRYYNERTNN